MKRILSILILLIAGFSFAQKIPAQLKTNFAAANLQDKVETNDGKLLTIENVLNQYKGNIVVLDLWATWCGDCVKGFPQLKTFKANNPDVKFVYFSMDKTQEAWKNGLEKYQLQGDHYYMGNNWKSDFSTSIDLNWIPRYLILDQNGNIAKYYAVTTEDPEVQNTINKLRKN